MKRGPKPKPTALKELAGNPGKRPLNECEPQPEKGEPDRPGHFDEAAWKAWEWLVDTLYKMRILAKSDLAIMTLYCDTWSEYLKAREGVNKLGLWLIAKDTGLPYTNPMVNTEAMFKKQLMQYLGELGLSPSSRTRIQATPEPAKTGGKGRFFKVVGA